MTIAPPPRVQRVPRPLTEAEQAAVDARRAKEQALIDAKLPGLLAKFGPVRGDEILRPAKESRKPTTAYVTSS